jgi:hypothetical protein
MGIAGEGYNEGIPISLYADGSGYLANGNFGWDADGVLTINSNREDPNRINYGLFLNDTEINLTSGVVDEGNDSIVLKPNYISLEGHDSIEISM